VLDGSAALPKPADNPKTPDAKANPQATPLAADSPPGPAVQAPAKTLTAPIKPSPATPATKPSLMDRLKSLLPGRKN
jgi:hypothetical protein